MIASWLQDVATARIVIGIIGLWGRYREIGKVSRVEFPRAH